MTNMMKKTLLTGFMALLPLLGFSQSENNVSSPTEGVITYDYLGENGIQQTSIEMLAKFMQYAKNIYTTAGTNSQGTSVGYFKANSAGQNNEDGVRTNADLAMLSAFVYQYGQKHGVTLPSGVTYQNVLDMALGAIRWAYSTHRSTQLKTCTNNAYWGTSGTSYVWESSLWTESLGFATWFLKDKLTANDLLYIKKVICAEADYELTRNVPTGYAGDTKAEENGWETNVLAIACALYPDEANSDAWYAKMQSFAFNCYSLLSDATNETLVDGKPAKEWYVGQNLYDDYTLQNHNYFHTSYQNVVIQELCESYLALKCMQQNGKYPMSETLLWNQKPMFDAVLKDLALADGELAMPTGNDWSMFLYDQLPAFAAMATIFQDNEALMLENLALKYTKARQSTTSDGSWMLNSDIGPRRMGVTGHRVMMTYLFHEYFSVGNAQPSTWDDFVKAHSTTKYFETQNLVRSLTKDRFTAFYWNDGKQFYSGEIVPNSVDKNKIMVPFVTHNTGNILGTYSKADNKATLKGQYSLFPDAYAMNGSLLVGGSIPRSFVLYSTPGNAVILLDALKGNTATSVSSEQVGMMGISVDPFTKEKRTLYTAQGSTQTNGSSYSTWNTNWVNIDNQVGIVSKKEGTNTMAFGDRSNNNSIYTAKIYPSYSASNSSVGTDMNHEHCIVYYSNVDAATTQSLCEGVQNLQTLPSCPEGYHGAIVPDPDGTHYLLITNLFNANEDDWTVSATCPLGAPVFTQTTTYDAFGNAQSTFHCAQNFHIANVLKLFLTNANASIQAVQADENPQAAYIYNSGSASRSVTVKIVSEDGVKSKSVSLASKSCYLVSLENGSITTTTATFPGNRRNVAYASQPTAKSYDGEHLPFASIDNSADTYWKSLNKASAGGEYLKYTLYNLYSINQVVITPALGVAAPTSATVQYATKDNAFVNVPNASITTDAEGRMVVNFDAVDARYVKVKLFGGAQPIAIQKVAIYGEPAKVKVITDTNTYVDETSNYLSNPSFENDNTSLLSVVNSSADGLRGWELAQPSGWSVSGTDVTKLLVTADCYADNNFGKITTIPDGTQAYYLRMGWNTGTTTLSQTTQTIPAGTYHLLYSHRSGYANSATSSFEVTVAGATSDKATFTGSPSFPSLAWSTDSVEFTLSSEQSVTISATITWASGGSCVMFDDFRLHRVISDHAFEYDALRQQIIQNGGDATYLLSDTECNGTGAWSNVTGTIRNQESWRGTETNTYLERTSSGTMSQTIPQVPAGKYKVVAAARTYAGGKIQARLTNSSGTSASGTALTGLGNGSGTQLESIQINTNGVEMPYSELAGFTTNNRGRNWRWISAEIEQMADGPLTVSFVTTGNSWMCFDDVHLYLVETNSTSHAPGRGIGSEASFCQSISATANQLEVSATKTVMADIRVENPNTLIWSETPVITAADALANNSICNGAAGSMMLYDGYDFANTTASFTVSDATYVRSMSDSFGTALLPYPAQSSSSVQFYAQRKLEGGAVVLNPVDEIPASTPAIFQKLNTDASSVSIAGAGRVVLTTAPLNSALTLSTWKAEGSYAATEVTNYEGVFYLASDQLWEATSIINLPAFRTVYRPSSANGVKGFSFIISDEPVDGISALEINPTTTSSVYHITGQKLSSVSSLTNLPSGIYIANGKKFIK